METVNQLLLGIYFIVTSGMIAWVILRAKEVYDDPNDKRKILLIPAAIITILICFTWPLIVLYGIIEAAYKEYKEK